jgi:hypothetical protein
MKNPTLLLKPRILLLFTLLCAAVASVQSVHAVTITVMNTADSGMGSLREALADANDGDTIDFGAAVTGTITLSSGQLVVNDSITISGPGAGVLAVNGNGTFRVFEIASGKTVSISGLTMTNGKVVSVTGGGLRVPTGSTVSIANSTVSNNVAAASNGGAISNAGTLTITDSDISNNFASFGGGGVLNNGSGTLTITGSTFTGNSTAFAGGALLNGGTLTVNNSTFSANDIDPCGCGPTGGAVLWQTAGTATINNSTIAGNTQNLDPINTGLGVIANTGGTVSVRGTIVAKNTTNLGGNCTGTITDDGYNLEDTSPSTCGFSSANNSIVGSDPMLGPLADNGGPTFTRALLPNSPAIDKGKNFSGSSTDQRGTGFARTYDDPAIANATGGDGTDIGAFEVQAPTPTPTPYAAQIQQPINADGTSVFNVRRGIVPVKFTLTLDGVSTCDLPPATIAMTRTAGGTTGPIDESVYSGPADTGSNFRIDSCQYIYNLSASALGAGTYEVDILINGQVVGSATFTLR